MSKLRRSVPSLGALAVFEAAARLGGFTKAADELGVTQAAVSRQIRALETDLNTPLFVRAHRRIQLTTAGRVLFEAVGQSFERISDAIHVVRHRTQPRALTVSTTLAFSHFWLLPRLPSFRTTHPDLELRVISQDGAVDLRDGELDVLLRFGKPPFRDGTVLSSHLETAFPVCSPEFAESLRDFDVGALGEMALIELEPEPHWLTWRQWFAMAGLDGPSRRSALRFNHYSDAVYAAINGDGITLGWNRLLERPLADGRLLRLGDIEVTPGEGHNVVVPAHAASDPAVMAFVDWINESFDTPP